MNTICVRDRGRARHRGFSLIEVLVALIVIGIGMLGIAKIQALAYAATGTAAQRSIAAIQASSLAAAMRANRDYWSVTAATAEQKVTINYAGAFTPAPTDGLLANAAPLCTAGVSCSAPQMAAYDLHQWGASLIATLTGSTAVVDCQPPTMNGSPAGYPVGCYIQITWVERNAAINSQSQGQTMAAPTYTLYVEP